MAIHNHFTKTLSIFGVLFLCYSGIVSAEIAKDKSTYPYIIKSVPIAGFVMSLYVSKKNPDVLFVLVGHDGAPKDTNKTGLYAFDISDPGNPVNLDYFSMFGPFEMDINKTETRAYVYSRTTKERSLKVHASNIRVLDISSPRKIRQTGFAEVGFYAKPLLSLDDKYLFVSSDVYTAATHGNPELVTRLENLNSTVYGIFQSDGGKRLYIRGEGKSVYIYDVTNQAAPKLIKTITVGKYGIPQAMGKKGTALLTEYGNLNLVRLFPNQTMIGQINSRNSPFDKYHFSDDEKTLFAFPIGKIFYEYDLSNPGYPEVSAEYAVPDYVHTAVPGVHGNYLYAGLLGSVAVIDTRKYGATAEGLITAHAQALHQYKNPGSERYDQRSRIAINTLKAAGITQVLKRRPEGISGKKLAEVLNDYGFFLEKSFQYDEAVKYYTKVIELDPGRAVVYLNIGDSLRAGMRNLATFTEKRARAKIISNYYKKYQALANRSNKEINDYLALNMADHPIENLCNYITSYANHGRLQEIAGPGKDVLRLDGKSRMDVVISSSGSANLPEVIYRDSQTGKAIWDAPDVVSTEDLQWTENILIVPFKNGHNLLTYTDLWHLDRTIPIGIAREENSQCSFNTKEELVFESNQEDKKLCDIVKSGSHIFEGRKINYSITSKTMAERDRRFTYPKYATEVDFDNDGVVEPIVYLQYEGSGRCAFNYFEMLNKDKSDLEIGQKRSILHSLQSLNTGAYHASEFFPSCSANTINWIHYGGKTYLENQYKDRATGDRRDMIHSVVIYDKGKIKEVCKGSYNYRIEY